MRTMTEQDQNSDDESIYSQLADKNGYVDIEPTQEMYCVGRFDGERIKVGFREEIKGEGSINQEVEVFRSGPYRVHYNNRFISTEDGQRRQHRVKVEQANDADEEKTPVTEISGLGVNKADLLINEGYESIQDVKDEEQDKLADIDGIGFAMAARIKADVQNE